MRTNTSGIRLTPRANPEEGLQAATWGFTALLGAARLAVTMLVTLGIGALLWFRVGNTLSVRTAIVGRTTFANFDVYHYLDHFYIAALAMPAIGTITYFLLSRWGPLQALPLSATHAAGSALFRPREVLGDVADTESHPMGWALATSAGARLLAPAAVVAVEVGTGIGIHRTRWSPVGWVAAIAYAAVVLGVGVATARLRRDRGGGTTSFVHGLSVANAIFAPVVVLLIGLISASTTVTIGSGGGVVHYGWFPWWLASLVTLAIMVLVARGLHSSSGLPGARRMEQRTLVWVVAPVFIFLMTAYLLGAIHSFSGFDDSQGVVGATLLFQHGLFPWRDAFLLHGVLDDAFNGQIGLSLFSHTLWGSFAGERLIVFPLSVVAVYWFIAYFSRGKSSIALGATVILVFTPFASPLLPRYAPMFGVLILFYRVLESGSIWRCWWLAGGIILAALLSPETTVLMLPIIPCLVLSELSGYRRGMPLRAAFYRTIQCAIAGASLLAVWVIILAGLGSLSGFVDYYRSTISGHELWGAYGMTPLPWSRATYGFYFFAPIGMYLLTVAEMVRRYARKADFEPLHFVILAAAISVPLFYQVYLDRADLGHLYEVFAAVTPLVCLWGIAVTHWADSSASTVLRSVPSLWGSRTRLRLVQPVAVIVAIVLVISQLHRVGRIEVLAAKYRPRVPKPPATALPFGYVVLPASRLEQISALGAALDRYAGPTAPVFDFVNEMGIPYFLLDRVPGARFYHVESAQTPLAQAEEIADLRKSRPPVVIFFDRTFGLPVAYDGISSEVRNYSVSQYLLDHYTPLEDVDGQLLLSRNDLYAGLVRVGQVPDIADGAALYFDVAACNWGDVPNFFVGPTSGELARATEVTMTRSPAVGGWDMGLPPGSAWTNYQWLEFRSPTPATTSKYTITDQAGGDASHSITFQRMRRSGAAVFLRVGSCLQWHGYAGGELSVQVSDPPASLAAYLVP